MILDFLNRTISALDYLSSLMKQIQNQCLVETKRPELTKNPVGSMLVKEGKNLPMSETEDVGGYSLAPTYSAKQIRRMERLRIKTIESGLVYKLKSGGRLHW